MQVSQVLLMKRLSQLMTDLNRLYRDICTNGLAKSKPLQIYVHTRIQEGELLETSLDQLDDETIANRQDDFDSTYRKLKQDYRIASVRWRNILSKHFRSDQNIAA